MANPLEKIKAIKGRSFDELLTRGEQLISGYSEKMGLVGGLPDDQEFAAMMRSRSVSTDGFTPDGLRFSFLENAEAHFFPGFSQKTRVADLLRNTLTKGRIDEIIATANAVVNGRFDLLGHSDIQLGKIPDWHLEPLSNKRSPLKHWKDFDELETELTGDKKVVWELNRHQHFYTLGVAFRLTGDERYAECFAAHLADWMEQNPPAMGINWFSSLELALRSISWLWAFNLFRDARAFGDELFLQAVKFLYMHGKHIEKYLSTYYSPNTHLTGEGLGLYYLGTQLPFLEIADKWKKLGEDILLNEIERQIYSDGVYFEQSTAYQKYTIDFYTHFLILRSTYRREIDQRVRPRLYAGYDFLVSITSPDGTTPLIGDEDGGNMLPFNGVGNHDMRGSLAVAAVLFERGEIKNIIDRPTEDVVWLLGSEGVEAFDRLEKQKFAKDSRLFVEGGYFVMRDGSANEENFMLVDAGELGEGTGAHAHADALAVIASIKGRSLLVDSGTYTYHESKKLRDYFRSTTAHNTLTIDKVSSAEPGNKFSWKTKSRSKIDNVITHPRFDLFEGSHDGYERLASPATHSRSILFIKNEYSLIRDEILTDGDHEYALNFHFAPGVEANIGRLENGTPYLTEKDFYRLFTFGDNGGWQKKDGWVSRKHGSREPSAFLRYIAKGSGRQEFYSFVLPEAKGAEKPTVTEIPIADGRAFLIKTGEFNDFLIFNDSGRIIRNDLFDSDFKYTWARFPVGETVPQEVLLTGGRHFSVARREIINHPSYMEFASATLAGRMLNVSSKEANFSVSIPQNRSRTLIVKNDD